jgi:phthalate 4,5-cis-dihydrodiol dehydrogenase
MAQRKIRLGIAGLGRAFTLMLPTLATDPRLQLVAAADPRAEACNRFAADFNANTYTTVENLCDDPAVEAIYIATPHQVHAKHVGIAASRGKHVLVEKPMAITLSECAVMIEAAQRAGVHLIVGHSHSFNGPILHARDIIVSGKMGDVRMIHALNYTDYMYRPRRPEELDTAQGGGVIFSQGAHQIDIVRLLGGGNVRTVRAAAGAWDSSRPTEGAYSAFLTFENGAFATATYSGYAHFDSDEFNGWIGEIGLPKDRSRYGATRKALQTTKNADEEAALKNARNYGGADYVAAPKPTAQARQHQHFGTVVVSCDRADLRPMPDGVMIYGNSDIRMEKTPIPAIPRTEVIDELYAAIVHNTPPLHSGEWARATMEVCLAILQSQRDQAEIKLRYQTGLQQTQQPGADA